MSTSVRTWCSTEAGFSPSASAISLLVRGSCSVTRRIRSRSGDAIAFASASSAGRRAQTCRPEPTGSGPYGAGSSGASSAGGGGVHGDTIADFDH